jgi:hypothetical protein
VPTALPPCESLRNQASRRYPHGMGLTTSPTTPDEAPTPWGRRLVIIAVVVGVVAAVVTIKVRWWRRGGGRRTVTKLAEAGAVALADALVDELLPAA